jgi:RNA polymerase sigma factor (sigma-70 family)
MSLDINTLYQLHCKELLHHLLRFVKCPEIAQDLVQESYLVLVRTSADTVIDHPRGFLYRTAGNLALDHLRHNKIVERHQEAAQSAEPPQQVDVEKEIADQQWRAMLHQTIDELPSRCRDIFILHKFRGLSYREIAQLLDISESAVEKHIIKGLQHCRNRLGKHYNRPYHSN